MTQPATVEQWIETEFDRCWPYIESAIRKMREPFGRDHVWGRIVDKSAQFWPGPECAVLTEINVRTDGSKIIFGWIAGGNRDQIEIITAIAERWGKEEEGCTLARAIQRPGFKRKPLPGWKCRAVIMEKEL